MKPLREMTRWDAYFLKICQAVSENSVCYSRQIGAILVRNKSIISTGYNGPPRAIHHCGMARINRDPFLREIFVLHNIDITVLNTERCPRRIIGHNSGEGLELCPAVHAEQNCIANAAKIGVRTQGTTLYMNDQIPCRICLGMIINAGIVKVVVTKLEFYDDAGRYIARGSDLKILDYYGKHHEMSLEN